MTAYYNEHDPKAAAWLRELIKQGHIADGEVDERSIEDVTPIELAGFTQCHFFAGIGGWSYALRQAGFGDDEPVWTGSCPCQPFSAAGKGEGFADERHLWPAFYHLISQCRPPIVFGEQVASKDGLTWLDLVQLNMEDAGYAFGALDTCAAGIGSPHIRQRLYFVADSASEQHDRAGGRGQGRGAEYPDCGATGGMADALRTGRSEGWSSAGKGPTSGCGELGLMGNPIGPRLEGHGGHGDDSGRWPVEGGSIAEAEPVGPLADTAVPRHDEAREHERGSSFIPARPAEHGGVVRPTGPTNGFWRDADWLHCRDDKWRPVKPGAQPLVDGIAGRMGRVRDHGAPLDAEATAEGRVMRLRGYGNAICVPVATAFIQAYRESVV